MATFGRKLSTGHSVLFDKGNRAMYLINPKVRCSDVRSANKLVQEGKALKFDRRQLGVLQNAMREVILLA